MSNKNTYDVIVVGAGVIGCSIAYHLARAGLNTALLDQAQVGAGASGANFGEVMPYDAELKHSIPMVKASHARYDHLEDELGMQVDFRRMGALRMFFTEGQWKAIEERSRILTRAGIPYEFVPAERIREIEPLIEPTGMFGGVYCSCSGTLNPFLLMWAYLRRATSLGLSLHTYTVVTGFEIKSGRMLGVNTNRGIFFAGSVVLATAAWTRRLGKVIDRDWHINNFRASAMITEPVYHLKLNTIVTWGEQISLEVTGREDSEQIVLGLNQVSTGQILISQADRPGDSVDPVISHAAPKVMSIMAARCLPSLRQVRILRSWTAPTTFTDDGCPLLGFVKDIEGLILATSYRSAIIHSPLAGEVVAQLVTMGRCEIIDISHFAPERDMGGDGKAHTARRTYVDTEWGK